MKKLFKKSQNQQPAKVQNAGSSRPLKMMRPLKTKEKKEREQVVLNEEEDRREVQKSGVIEKRRIEDVKVPQVQQSVKLKPNLKPNLKKFPKVILDKPDSTEHSESTVFHQSKQIDDQKFKALISLPVAQLLIPEKKVQLKVSRREQQLKRAQILSKQLIFQIEANSQILTIDSSNPYKLYTAQIQSGLIKNSEVQLVHRADQGSQTVDIEQFEKMVQAPEDRQLDFDKEVRPAALNEWRLRSFLQNFQSALQQFSQVQVGGNFLPQMWILSLNPQIRQVTKLQGHTCIIYQFKIEAETFSLIEFKAMHLIFNGSIRKVVLTLGSVLAATSLGQIVVWDLSEPSSLHEQRSQRHKHLISKVNHIEDPKVLLRFPCEASFIAKDQSLKHLGQVKGLSLVDVKNNYSDIASIDNSGHTILWRLRRLTRQELRARQSSIGIKGSLKLQPISQLRAFRGKTYNVNSVNCWDSTLYVCTSLGPLAISRENSTLSSFSYENLGEAMLASGKKENQSFVVGWRQGCISLFVRNIKKPVWKIFNCFQGKILNLSVLWSPLVFLSIDDSGLVSLYDLARSSLPVLTHEAKNQGQQNYFWVLEEGGGARVLSSGVEKDLKIKSREETRVEQRQTMQEQVFLSTISFQI